MPVAMDLNKVEIFCFNMALSPSTLSVVFSTVTELNPAVVILQRFENQTPARLN